MARKSNTISVLQIDAQGIARLRINRSAQGVEVLEHDVQRGNWSIEDGSLEAAIKECAERWRLGEDALCTVIPRHEITARILTLPSHSLEEIQGMVRLSAEEFVPYAVDELVIDQCVLEKMPHGESRVLVALAHRDVVEGHLALLRKAGLEPERILLSSACFAAAATQLGESDRFAVVNLGVSSIEVMVMDGVKLQFSRGVGMVQDWSLTGEEAAGAVQELAVEVRGSLAAYRRDSEDGIGVDRVLLCSDWVNTAYMAEALAAETAKECLPVGSLSRLVVSGADKLQSVPLIALGAALAVQERAPIQINLVPPAVHRERELEDRKGRMLQYLALAAAFLVALGALYAQAVHQRQTLIGNLDKRLAVIEPNARDVAEKQAQLSILRHQVDRDGTALEYLAKVFEAAPLGKVTVTRFTFHRTEGVNLFGHASTVDDVHTFAQSLRNLAKLSLPLLANAHSVYENQTDERGVAVWDYHIAIPFAGEKNAEPPASDNQ